MSCCKSIDPYRRPEHIYGVFITLAGLYQKSYPKKLLVTFNDLKWPWRHDEGSPVTIFRLRMSILPVTRCLRVFWMSFVQKRRLSYFSHGLIMERSKNWPDLRSPISKFRDLRFIDTGTFINRWKFQGDRSFGVAMRNIQSFFFWGEVT